MQANSDYPYLKDWQQLLHGLGLSEIQVKALDGLPSPLNVRKSKAEILSRIFTVAGKINAWMNPFLLWESSFFKGKQE